MKTILAVVIAAVCLQTFAADTTTNKNSRTGPFILGAEVSWAPEDEADGAVYYDHGVKKDIFAILKDYQFNYIRLRLFVDPGAPDGYAANRQKAFCDLAHVEAMAKRARAAGLGILLDIHYSDTWSSPGHQKKPLVWENLDFAGLTKAEIRGLSAQLGLPTADKPQMACLSSRIPHGEAVTPEKLAMIEQAENVLRDLGFHDVRVRHHELRVMGDAWRGTGKDSSDTRHSSLVTHLARIELGPAEIPRFLNDGLTAKVAEALKKIGYAHVTLDLQGYRRGSLNEKNEKLDSRFTDHASRKVERET